MPVPQTDPRLLTQRKTRPLEIPPAAVQASTADLTQFGTGTVRICLPLPIRSTIAQCSSLLCSCSSGQVRQLGSVKPTAKAERQDGSTALAPEGLDVGAVQQGFGLLGSEPVAQSETQPLGPFHAANARRQLRTQQACIARLVSQSSYRG